MKSAIITSLNPPSRSLGHFVPANPQDYLGRLVQFYGRTYIICKVQASGCKLSNVQGIPLPPSASLYLVRENGPDDQPEGFWQDASRIEAPGKTILHWHHNHTHREPAERCAILYEAAIQAAEERKAEQERANKARQEEEARCEQRFRELCPEWAKAYIIAELREDQSDTQQDYWGYRVTETVLLAFCCSERNSFPEMRKAVASFQPASHLVTEGEEHRENYSGGGGYYLSAGSRYSGWVVRKRTLKYGLPRGGWAVMDFSHWITTH